VQAAGEGPQYTERVTASSQHDLYNRLQSSGRNTCSITEVEVIADLETGLNYRKKGMRQSLLEVLQDRVARLVIVTKDRSYLFGSALLFALPRVLPLRSVGPRYGSLCELSRADRRPIKNSDGLLPVVPLTHDRFFIVCASPMCFCCAL
jgi:hypothetical protein